MFHIIVRVLSLLREEKMMVFSLTITNLVFAALILVEPIFFKEIIDTLIGFSATETPSYK